MNNLFPAPGWRCPGFSMKNNPLPVGSSVPAGANQADFFNKREVFIIYYNKDRLNYRED